MDSNQASLQLLSHFDDAPPDAPEQIRAQRVAQLRGIGWVLRWAAAIAVLFYCATVLTEFFYALAAEQMLVHAAEAGVHEATLPRATFTGVEQTVWQRLAGSVESRGDVRLMLLANEKQVGRKWQPHDGDDVSIALQM